MNRSMIEDRSDEGLFGDLNISSNSADVGRILLLKILFKISVEQWLHAMI